MGTRARWNRGTWWGLLGLLAVGLFMPLAAAAPVPAFHAPNPSAPPQSWAWGATFVKNDQGSLTGNGTVGSSWSLSYTIHAFVSWNTILTQTNTSTTTFSLNAQRVMAASFFLSATGNNGPESGTLNVTAQGWEQDNGASDFTTTGTVLLNGTTVVPAVAVEDASGNTSGNFTATSSAQMSGPQSGSWNAYQSAAAQAQASIAFTPALGLFPLNFSAGSWWTSTSNYTAQGTYDLACHYGYSGTSQGGSVGGGANCGSSGSVSGSNSVTLNGADHDLDTAVPGHQLQRVVLQFQGVFGFELRDGMIFVPTHADLFTGGAATVGGSAPGSPAASAQLGLNYLDVNPHSGHLGVEAANAQFGPGAGVAMGMGMASPMTSMVSSVGGTSTPQASSPAALSSYGVQAQPESPAQAEHNNGCLLSVCGAPSSGLFSPLMALVIVGVAAAVIVGAVMVERSRRPKLPAGGYSTRPPSAFLLHSQQGQAPAGGNPYNAPQTPGYQPGRPRA